jgi:hypothetical protein
MAYNTISCNYQEWREVRKGLDTSIDQLPKSQDFETVTILRGESSMEGCYYAVAKVILGSFMPTEEALDMYTAELQSLGWSIERNDYKNVISLTRNTQERIVIETGYPSLSVEKNEDYIRARDIYPTIIFARLVFYVPQRDGC